MNHWLRNFILLALMLAASAGAFALRPSRMIADQGPAFDAEAAIPHSFADWRQDEQPSALIIDPQQQQTLDTIYSQTLSRTYVNSHNDRVMLSIAYGRDQRDANQAHKPEVCYPAQGFLLLSKQAGKIETTNGVIAVTRIHTNLGQRFEPVTYWTTVGSHVVVSGLDKKIRELNYGLKGEIPDGLLFRVSSINPDTTAAFSLQESFVRDLLNSLEPTLRKRISGLGS